MENGSNPGAPSALSALALYDLAVTSLRPTPERWMEIADLLRAEAAGLTGSQRTKRIDRALDCESRALAARTVQAARTEAVRAGVRAALAARPDFVPARAS